jgi:hypothetical protein
MVRRTNSVVLAAAVLLVAACATAPLPTASPTQTATPLPTPGSLPSPTPTSTATESPTPSRPPSPTPAPTATPGPPPPQPYIFSTDEFVAAFRRGALDGKTVLVDGSVPLIGRGTGCSPPPPDFPCPLGVLAGTDLVDVVWYERWAVKENDGAHFEGGGITWPWWGGPDWPVAGLLVMRVTDDGKIQFVGRQRRLVRSVPDAKGLDVNSIDPEEVVLVEGWLTGFGGIPSCLPTPSDAVAGLPDRWCSNAGYLMDSAHRHVSNDADRAAGIELQHEAYWEYAPDPRPEVVGAGDGEPRFGTYALSPRLEGWCAQGQAPCWQWNLVGRVDPDSNLTARERIDQYWLDFDDAECIGMAVSQSLQEAVEGAELIVLGRPTITEPWPDSPFQYSTHLVNVEVSEILKGALPDDASSVIQVLGNYEPPVGNVSDIDHVLLLSHTNRDDSVYYLTEGWVGLYANVDGRVVTSNYEAVKARNGNHIFSTGLDGTRFDKLLERIREAANSSAQQRLQTDERAFFAC